MSLKHYYIFIEQLGKTHEKKAASAFKKWAKEIAIDVFDAWIDKLKQSNPELYGFFKSHSFFTQGVISNIANFIERHCKFIQYKGLGYILFKDRGALEGSLQELAEDLMGNSGNENC